MSLRNLDVDQVGQAVYRHCTSPKALYITLIERWWVIVVGCLIGIVAGCILLKTTQKQFASSGRLLVYQKLPTFLDESSRLPDPKAYDSLFATHLQLIASPLIVDKAIQDFQLDELVELDMTHAKHRELGNKPLSELIRENLKASRAGSGDSAGAFVISLKYSHKSAKECPLVVNAILKTYQSYVNDSMLDDQTTAVQLLDSLQARLESDIEEKATAYRDFLKNAPGVWDQSTKTNSHKQRVETFEEELTQLEIQREAISSRLTMLNGARNEEGMEFSSLEKLALVDDIHLPRIEILVALAGETNVGHLQQVYPELQEVASVQYDDLLDKMTELSSLSQNIGESHPNYQDALAELEVLRSQLVAKAKIENGSERLTPADLVKAYETLLREELENTQQRIEFIRQRIKEEVDASKLLNDYSVQADLLKDEYDRSHELASLMLDKVQKQTVRDQYGSYIAEIIASPRKGQLIWPKKPITLGLCTICGLFGGGVIALLLDLIQVSPLRQLFRFLPNWLIRRDRFPSSGSPAV